MVHNNDVAALQKLPGIGKKTAERLVIEMRDKLKDWPVGMSDDLSAAPGVLPSQHQASEEAVSALLALGYKPKDAESAIKAVASDELSSQDMIRQALKSMAGA